MGRLSELVHVRLTDDELKFIRMISERTGLNLSESVRLAINMFRVILGLEAVDVERVGRAIREAAERAAREMSREELEELRREEEAWERARRSASSLRSLGGGG